MTVYRLIGVKGYIFLTVIKLPLHYLDSSLHIFSCLIHLFSTKKSLDLNKNYLFSKPKKNPDPKNGVFHHQEVSKKLIPQNHSKTGWLAT